MKKHTPPPTTGPGKRAQRTQRAHRKQQRPSLGFYTPPEVVEATRTWDKPKKDAQ